MPRTYPPRALTQRLQLIVSEADREALEQLAQEDAQRLDTHISLNATVRRLIREEARRRQAK